MSHWSRSEWQTIGDNLKQYVLEKESKGKGHNFCLSQSSKTAHTFQAYVNQVQTLKSNRITETINLVLFILSAVPKQSIDLHVSYVVTCDKEIIYWVSDRNQMILIAAS